MFSSTVVLLLLLFLGIIILGVDGATLVTYTPVNSVFTVLTSSSPLSAPLSFTRLVAAYQVDEPRASAAIFGPTQTTLLTVSESLAGGIRLCEWNISREDNTPLRCIGLGSVQTMGLPHDMVYVAPNILIAFPSANTVLSVNYVSFQVDSNPWMSSAVDSFFLAPSALEFDAIVGQIYVALQDADAVRRFTVDGTVIDSAAAPWISVPRPSILVLTRNDTVPSLYVLTNDATLPEMYKFRLGDGASLSVVANSEGDWFPDNSTELVSATVQDGTLYTLSQRDPGGVSAFSVISANPIDLSADPVFAPLNAELVAPLALIKDAQSSSLLGVIDSQGFFDLAGNSFFFDACTPGMASGGTLDGSSVMSILLSGDTQLLVADTRSLYWLSLKNSNGSQQLMCFDGYVIDPETMRALLSENSVSVADAIEVYEDRLIAVITSSLSNWSVYWINVYDGTTASPVTASLPSYQGHVSRFAIAPSVVCELRLDTSAILACTNGTFQKLTNTSLETAVDAAWDRTRLRIWITFRNGSVLLADPAGASIDHYLTVVQPTLTDSRVEAFLFDTNTSTPSWIISQSISNPNRRRRQVTTAVSRSYAWYSCSFDNNANPSVLYLQVTNVLGNFSSSNMLSSVFATTGSFGSTLTIVPEPSECSGSFIQCNPGRFGIGLAIIMLLMIWGVIILLLCLRKRRRTREQRPYSRMTFDTNGNQSETTKPHLTACRWLRTLIKKVFCFCHCCYDSSTGYLCCCYSLLGGQIRISQQMKNVTETDTNGTAAVSEFVDTTSSFSITDNTAASGEQQQSTGTDPFVGGSGNTMHSVSLTSEPQPLPPPLHVPSPSSSVPSIPRPSFVSSSSTDTAGGHAASAASSSSTFI